MKKTAIILILFLIIYPAFLNSQNLIDAVNEVFTGVKTIDVKGNFCSVEFEENAGSTVRFEGEIRAIKQYEGLYIKRKKTGDVLEVWIEIPKNVTGQIKGFLNFSVPRDVLVKISTVSGSVSVSNVGREELSINTVSGSITVKNIPCSAKLASVSGSITCNLALDDLIVKSTSGNIKVVDIKGDAVISSTSGSLNIKNVMKNLNANTVSGNINASGAYSKTVCKSTSGKIELTDIKGFIEANNMSQSIILNNVIGEITASSVSGSITGNSVMITGKSSFITSSGNIYITLLNTNKSVSYDLRSTIGRVEADNIKGGNSLIINEGSIKITGSTTSGNIKFNYK